MHERNEKSSGKCGCKVKVKWRSVVCCNMLFADDTVLLAESEGDLQRVVNEFYSGCKRRKLKVNVGKSKVMVFERRAVVVRSQRGSRRECV